MMRAAILLPGLALALAAPVLAFGQTVNTGQGRLDLSGVAPSACLISTPTAAAGSNSSFQPAGTQSGQVTITQMVDPNTAVPVASSINLALPIICNAAHNVTVSTTNGGLARAGVAPGAGPVGGFRQFLPYQVTATWAGQTQNATSQAGTTVSINSSDGAAGQLSLTIAVPGGGDPMVAGAYSDQVVVQLQVAS